MLRIVVSLPVSLSTPITRPTSTSRRYVSPPGAVTFGRLRTIGDPTTPLLPRRDRTSSCVMANWLPAPPGKWRSTTCVHLVFPMLILDVLAKLGILLNARIPNPHKPAAAAPKSWLPSANNPPSGPTEFAQATSVARRADQRSVIRRYARRNGGLRLRLNPPYERHFPSGQHRKARSEKLKPLWMRELPRPRCDLQQRFSN